MLTALRSGEYLKRELPDIILASPLRRARQTAEMIRAEVGSGTTVECHDLLKEVHLPHWEGLTFTQIRRNFSAEYRTWKERPHELCIGRGDSAREDFKPVLDLYRRATKFWNDVLPPYAGKRLLVVSHGGTTRALIGSALGIPPSVYHRTQQSNGGLSMIEFERMHAGGGRIDALNVTSHLHSRLPKLKEGKEGIRLVLVPLNHADSCQFVDHLKPDFVTTPPAFEIAKHFSEGTLRTGVVLGAIDLLLPILLTAAGVPWTDCSRWNMRQDHVSVIHYPQPDAVGVLQAFNIPINTFYTLKTDEGSQEGIVAIPCAATQHRGLQLM
jgi:probable phosphoglycerate mutase